MSEKFFSNPTCGQVSHRVVRLRYEMNAAAAANSLAELLLLLKQLRKVTTMCVIMVVRKGAIETLRGRIWVVRARITTRSPRP